MLDSANESVGEERPEMRRLLERLSSETLGWAEAEVNLARAELDELKSQAIRAAVFSGLALAAVLAAVFALTQAGIAFLASLLDSEAAAALIVGVVLVVLAGASLFIVRSSFSWRTESIFFRWFGHRDNARS